LINQKKQLVLFFINISAMKSSLSIRFILMIFSCLLFSCKSNTQDDESGRSVTARMASESTPPVHNISDKATDSIANLISSEENVKMERGSVLDNMELKTFEVKDSSGKSKGWGYDIFVTNVRTIHQPIIPAIPGNKSFKTESDAKKIGLLALSKMKKSGGLPTILIKELDSLGISK
jgi:hypothetical protein